MNADVIAIHFSRLQRVALARTIPGSPQFHRAMMGEIHLLAGDLVTECETILSAPDTCPEHRDLATKARVAAEELIRVTRVAG